MGEGTGQHGIHGRRRARSFETAPAPADLASAAKASVAPGDAASLQPTSAAMGWGSYPPSAGSGSPAYSPPSPVALADAGAPSILPTPVPAGRTAAVEAFPALSEREDSSFAAPSSEPAASPGSPVEPAATAYFPAVPEAQPATRPVRRVPASEDAPIVRNVFPAAAQAFARDSAIAVAEPEPEHATVHPWDTYNDTYHEPALAEPADLHEDLPPLDSAHYAHPAEETHPFDDSHAVFGDPVVAKAAPRRRRRFRVIIGLTLALALFVGAVLLGVQFLKPILGLDKVKDFPGPGTGSVVVTVQPGSGPAAVASTLEKQDVIADSATFLKAFAAAGGSLHPGDYTFKKEMTSAAAAQILTGSSNDKVIYFALNAGMRVGESLDAIAQAASVNRKDLDALNAKPVDFGLPAKAKSLEGYLAPGEYRFPVGTSAKDILTKLVSTTLDTLKAAGVTDPDKQYDVLTVASIVQAEGGQADYGNVAGAIYNRLKPNPETNGLIQSDATVTYGLGKKSYHITDAEKADASNPYNTYQHTGLPAGPIGSPGTKALNAAANPTPNNYLYWVTVNLDTGETKFSSTYAQHQIYAQQYQQWCQANAGKCQ
ncbi:endolytic transglycosylase MltG [Sinomonas sp. P10A9]|uniref:Endolytic murein transglycosylase n=1 Tax=Sinomonas puerhi TaxID=3238584 RepID=A0AB39KY89_9MICC